MKADLSFKGNSVKGRVIVKFKNTDVLVLAIHYHPQMKNVKQLCTECGTTTATKNSHIFIPVHEICKTMSPTFCSYSSLYTFFDWSDFTSTFLEIGRKSVSKLLKTKGSERFEKLALMDG